MTLYQALHINQSTKVPIYEPGSGRVADAYDYEEMIDWSPFYDMIIGSNHPVIVYAGEYDQRDGPVTQVAWMRDLRKLRPNFWQQARKIYYINDGAQNITVGGYFRYDPETQFTFLTIPKSGHFVPTTQLGVTKQMLIDYIQNKKLVCHRNDSSQCETAPIMCNYMNNCSGNGQCGWNGMCVCN